MKYLLLLLSLVSVSAFAQHSSDTAFKKYTIEKGRIQFELKNSQSEDIYVEQVYFTNYGATEFYEFPGNNDPKFQTVFKQDSMQYALAADSSAQAADRQAENLFEKCIFDKTSKLYPKDLAFEKVRDMTYMGRPCQVYKFILGKSGMKGMAIVWNNIPLYINAKTVGFTESITVTKIDIETAVPNDKKSLPKFIKKPVIE